MLELGIWSFTLSRSGGLQSVAAIWRSPFLVITQPRLGILLQPIPKTIEIVGDLRLNPAEFCNIEFATFWSALREQVILDLGLCSRRTHGDARLIFQFNNRHPFFRHRVAFDAPDRLSIEIFDLYHLRSEHFGKGVRAVRLGQSCNFLCAFCSFENERPVLLRKIAKSGEDFVE